jgi:hypothetical protein
VQAHANTIHGLQWPGAIRRICFTALPER